MPPPPAESPKPHHPVRAAPDVADQSLWVAALYGELKALAQSELEDERLGHTLSATALVNEVYIKFAKQGDAAGKPRLADGKVVDAGMFFGLAAQAMRRILVDHARGRRRQKRGSGQRIADGASLRSVMASEGESSADPIELDESLTRLAIEHEQAARVVELRYFAGLPERVVAECLNIDERTVRRHWTFAKAWLARDMKPDGDSPSASVPDQQ